MTTLRTYFAWGLLAYVTAELFFLLMRWVLIVGEDTLIQRAYSTDFTTLTTVGLPILAVLISGFIQPRLAITGVVAKVALIQYLLIVAFGFLTFMMGLMHVIDFVHNVQTQIAALSYVVFGLLGLIMAGLAGLMTWRLQDPPTA